LAKRDKIAIGRQSPTQETPRGPQTSPSITGNQQKRSIERANHQRPMLFFSKLLTGIAALIVTGGRENRVKANL